GVRVVGDLPFVVATDSADVWVRRGEFMLDVSAGVPPDAFSESGQDWALPTYRWETIAGTNFAWMRQRARRMAALYDSVRIDHLVGFYRTFGRTPQGHAFFNPADEPTQTWQGEQILRIFLESGAEVLAEDLGTVPDFVRASMARLGVPGCKVLRWERHYHSHHRAFVDPATFSPVSVTMTGTHDTEPLAAWWDNASDDERRAFLAVPSARGVAVQDADASWSDALRDQILGEAYRSGSDHVFLPVQDVFGWRDRINTPATIDDANWSWRLPWPVDTLARVPEAAERAAFCRQLAIGSGRAGRT
ncbi:MAG TPA: 4-alpha-glucanotransferase, partial [Vicinamibacterales bacterium]|nr:4-alpha-glucanotransferase [Vicinamibacterales bacterium]